MIDPRNDWSDEQWIAHIGRCLKAFAFFVGTLILAGLAWGAWITWMPEL